MDYALKKELNRIVKYMYKHVRSMLGKDIVFSQTLNYGCKMNKYLEEKDGELYSNLLMVLSGNSKLDLGSATTIMQRIFLAFDSYKVSHIVNLTTHGIEIIFVVNDIKVHYKIDVLKRYEFTDKVIMETKKKSFYKWYSFVDYSLNEHLLLERHKVCYHHALSKMIASGMDYKEAHNWKELINEQVCKD
jgi:hypothetical protein